MKGMDNKAQTIDTDPMYDDRETVAAAEAEMERQEQADNLSDDSDGQGDNCLLYTSPSPRDM